MSYSDVFQRTRIAAAFCRWQKRNSTACNRAMRTRLLSRLGNPPSEAVKVTVGSHSFGRCCHVLPLCREDVHANPFSRGERHKGRQSSVTPRRGWKIKGRDCAAHRDDGCVTTPPRRHARRLTARSSLRVMCPQRTCGCTGLATMLCQYGHARPLSPNSRRAAMQLGRDPSHRRCSSIRAGCQPRLGSRIALGFRPHRLLAARL
jgi:hypothetical protein